MSDVLLTTIDNPWDPFTHWDEWLLFDEQMGYFTCPLLARVTITSDELSDLDQDLAIEEGMDLIIRENLTGIHKKVYRT